MQIQGLLPLFLVAIATQTTIPIPLDLIMFGMVATGFNKILVVVVAIIGLTIGASLDYILGRYEITLIPWFKKEMHTKTYKKAEKFYHQYGKWTLLVSFFPFIGKYFPLVSGIMKTPWLDFLSIYIFGKIVYYFLLITMLNKII